MDELQEIQKQIEDLQNKAHRLQQKQKAAIIEEIKDKIKTYGLTARELGFVDLVPRQPAEKTRKPVAVKYRRNENTWTGRGLKPKWVVQYLEAGGKLEDLAVQ